MKTFLLFLTIIFCFASSWGQNSFCASTEVNAQLMASDPVFYAKRMEAERIMRTASNESSRAGTVYQIPVVVHIVHTGGAIGTTYNPSDQTIITFINALNQAFRATYPSHPSPSTGGQDIEIEFLLAKRTPNCQATNGITRTDASADIVYVNSGVNFNGNQGISHTALANKIFWPNTDYLNIWLVNQIQGAGGYAYYPVQGYSFGDGTAMEVGSVNSTNSYLSAHEFGHLFNLRHTFQGYSGTTCPQNTSCTTQGDFVCDTEPHTNPMPCNPTQTNPCTGVPFGNVVYNYMNYSCHNRFTADQKVRMRSALVNIRSTLLISQGAVPPATITPTISISTTLNSCQGGAILYSAVSMNGGNSPTYQWQVNGNNMGSNSTSFSYIPAQNDQISCILTSNDPCTSTQQAFSNIITIQCPVSISGQVLDEQGTGIGLANLDLSGGFSQSLTTSSNGAYSFSNLPYAQNYVIAPSKNINPINGINTLDIVLTRRHILGIPLSSPYKILAADVDGSANVNSLDIVRMRQLILGNITQFPNGTDAWQFVPSNHTFSNPQNPFASSYTSQYSFNNITTDVSNQNFVGFKTGDVDVSANNNLRLARAGELGIELKTEPKNNNEKWVIFSFQKSESLLGIQFELNIDPNLFQLLEIQTADIPGLDIKNFNVGHEGVLRFSWDHPDGIPFSFSIGQEIFRLGVKDLLGLGEIPFMLSTDRLQAEAYLDLNSYLEPVLLIQPAREEPLIVSNYPNPFSEEMRVRVWLPKAQVLQFNIYDIQGKELHQVAISCENGVQDVRLDLPDIRPGIYFLQLKGEDWREVRQIIKNEE